MRLVSWTRKSHAPLYLGVFRYLLDFGNSADGVEDDFADFDFVASGDD